MRNHLYMLEVLVEVVVRDLAAKRVNLPRKGLHDVEAKVS